MEDKIKVMVHIEALQMIRPIEEREKLANELQEMFNAKNSDYGNSFEQTLNKYGLVAYCIRAIDKVTRLKTLYSIDNRKVKEESLLDTIKDLINYTAMTIMYSNDESELNIYEIVNGIDIGAVTIISNLSCGNYLINIFDLLDTGFDLGLTIQSNDICLDQILTKAFHVYLILLAELKCEKDIMKEVNDINKSLLGLKDKDNIYKSHPKKWTNDEWQIQNRLKDQFLGKPNGKFD